MPSVLFICTGNLYRSPFAAAYFKKELITRKLMGWNVESAGTWAVAEKRLPDSVLRYGELMGLDVAEHLTRSVDRDLLCDFGLILVMERGQKEALAAEFPDLKERVHLLTEFSAGAPFDVPDPAGAPDQAEQILRDLLDIIDSSFSRIVAFAELGERSGG